MYIIKNALRCISRARSRNVLIGIIALVIAVSACIGLSIRQAAESARESALKGMSVTATISYDRGGAMGQMGGGARPDEGSFDIDSFKDMMKGAQTLSLEEYERYASAKSVQDFYYTLTAYFNETDGFLAVSTESDTDDSFAPNFPGFDMSMFSGGGDFTVVGYSSDSAMTDFVNGNAKIMDGGTMFKEGSEDLMCVISYELAVYNGLSVGDTVVISNPSAESEVYTLTVCGIYESSATNDFSSSIFGGGQDPANKIYMSANALQTVLDASAAVSDTVIDADTGKESESKIVGNLSATYVFASTEDYYAFEDEVRALGLDESYTVSSSDITEFENSMAPLDTLSKMAGWFLLVILIIGGIILVVLNIFNVRERKYEVGVLTAMGMKKWKVAAQFMCEIFVVTMLAVIIGAGVGAVGSVPVTNALLQGQVESQNSQQDQMDQSFGRPGNMGGGSMPSFDNMTPPTNMGGGKGGNPFGNMFDGAANYISEVDSAMNLTVVFQMIGVGALLTLVASAASVLFIMRYDPLKILANRD